MKKMSKKFLFIGLSILLGIGLVGAIGYYALFSVSLNVNQPVSVEGDLEQSLTCNAGDTCIGDAITISNDADTPRTIKIVKNGDENVDVSYVGMIQLTTKDTSTWAITETKKADLIYTITGTQFEYSGVPEGYTLIYYKDAVIGLEGRLDNPQPAIQIISDIGNLPQSNDANLNADYSQAPDYYAHKTGAKLWAVPSTALSGNQLDWSRMGEFLYETDLIYSYNNADSELTIPANSFITFYPAFNPSSYIESGEYEFEFEIQ